MTPLQSTLVRPKPKGRGERGGQKDEEVPSPHYLRMVNVIRSLELFLQHIPISCHAAADCTC